MPLLLERARGRSLYNAPHRAETQNRVLRSQREGVHLTKEEEEGARERRSIETVVDEENKKKRGKALVMQI